MTRSLDVRQVLLQLERKHQLKKETVQVRESVCVGLCMYMFMSLCVCVHNGVSVRVSVRELFSLTGARVHECFATARMCAVWACS